jgi:hypothetical protein
VVTSLEDDAQERETSCSTLTPREDREALSLELSWFTSSFASFMRAFSSSMSILNAILSNVKAIVWDGGEGGSMYPVH